LNLPVEQSISYGDPHVLYSFCIHTDWIACP
jgi:hypothetical protein